MTENPIELEMQVDQIWAEKNWRPTAINNPKAEKVLPFVRSIRFKLYQAIYHLNNTLMHESKVQNFREGNYLDNATITKYEFDSLVYALNSVKDILAKLICTVYDVQTSKKIYFSTLVKEDENIFIELNDKNSVLLESLVNFNNTDERTTVSDYCNNIKHQDSLITSTFINENNKADIVTRVQPNSGELVQIRDLAPKLENIHRKAICRAGQLIIPNLGYKRAIDSPRDHFEYPPTPPPSLS